MNKVCGLMAVAMIITGAIAFGVGTYKNAAGELVLVKAIFGTWLLGGNASAIRSGFYVRSKRYIR